MFIRAIAPFFINLAALGLLTAADFQREVRPILSENCFQCHGPDSATRMAGLRLDRRDDAFQARKSGAPIVPGKPDASLIYQRIATTDASRRMPPESSHKRLTPKQIATIKQWIEQGAPWQNHWAFVAPVKAHAPAVRTKNWAINDIDRFILARLEAQGLTANASADRNTLIRRVALDLTGLPPKSAELDEYLSDSSPNAYERMVDRYLASPHFGEHRARYWLDLARYGDTHGIHVDNFREMWPYRDWVIQAFNRNMPFNRFTIEQLAGDLLPNPTLDQRIATGFHRCNVTTNEAGIIEDEYAEIYAKDRADTTAAVWLGMTVGCATCHDHKFDPISQKDFYALGAFFRNTTQKVMDDNIPDTPPIIVVPRLEDRTEWQKVSTELAANRKAVEQIRETARADFDRWVAGPRTTAVHPLDKKDELYTADLEALSATGKDAKIAESNVPGRSALFFGKDGVPAKTAPKLDADKPFTLSVGFFFPKAEQNYVIAAQRDTKDKNRGWTLDVGARVVSFRMVGDGGKNIEIRAGHLEQIQHGTWNHVTISYDGSRHQSGLNLYLNGRVIPTQGRGNQNLELPGTIAVSQPLTLGVSLAEGAISDFRIFNRVAGETEARLLSEWQRIVAASSKTGELDASDREALFTYYLVKEHRPFWKLAGELKRLTTEAKEIAQRGALTHVMQERTDSTPFANILYRGAYDQRRQRVDATTPAILPPMTSDMPRNRLGLAEWLFTADHPLTARVTVNRMWQEIFGTGIVKSADDFGSQGDPPSHPELLDWLAVDFRESGWDVKRFYKQVLMSATYRQSAAATPEKLAKDPSNRLMSRGPRFRMDAEMVRDYVLAASGLLNPQIGGPSVKPYQPDGVWEAVAMIGSNTRFYKRDDGDNLYRRSLYTFWKRSAPPASMDVFNAPTRENCTVRRERTNTPLQALVTMNDVQFVEAARALAETSMQSVSGFDGRLDLLASRILARKISAPERRILTSAFQDFRSYYASHEDDASKLLHTGEKKPDPALRPADYAAMTMLANNILNLDEALNK